MQHSLILAIRAMVPRKGLEPPRLAALAPEASANRYISTVVLTFRHIFYNGKLRFTRGKLKVKWLHP